ncbi:MAG: peptidoglycan DL-endopeptidase CwlO [Gaiellales bacterium]|nr:peptidoglycan DL-endopeptidase CwlO [Gaiellales bacterium]
MGHRFRHPLRWALCALASTVIAATPLVMAAPAQAAQRATPSGVLRLGSTGPLVKKLQHLLSIPADGVFGPGTRHAVKLFQRSHHLLADGQVGTHTWQALEAGHAHHRHAEHTRIHDGILRRGATGLKVQHVQKLLHVRVNGHYDRRTWRAVRRFQHNHHLLVDGQVGPHTLAALNATAKPVHHQHSHHQSAGGSIGARAAQLSRRYRGVRYVWGGTTPRNGFDCSGLVQYVYGRLGVELPRVTYSQWHAGRHVKRANLRAGDLVFFDRLGHVGIFLGHGWFMHAPQTGSVVHASRLHGWYARNYDGAVRIHA